MSLYMYNTIQFLKRRFFLIIWISIVLFVFYETFTCYLNERRFHHIRKILGRGLCISRGTATVINICCALVLLPLCKKLNQVLFRITSKCWPGLFFYWLESAKSFHMTVATTLAIFSVIHSISHIVNMWNFSSGYDEKTKQVNFANYKNENPLMLLVSHAGLTGVAMLAIIVIMSLTSLRIVRRRVYNAFWFTHQLYLPLLILMIIHPMSGVLKEEVLDETEASPMFSHLEGWNTTLATAEFKPIKPKVWQWMIVPLCCYGIDIMWRILSRNRAEVHIINATHMPGRTMNLIVSCPHNQFKCRIGQYVLLQCREASLIEWHPFTVTKVPTPTHREFGVWIRVKGDWTETVEKLLIERGPSQLRMLVDGPFSSPLEAIMSDRVAICVAAGIGITPFVSIMNHILMHPAGHSPGRIHLLWIVRYEHEITWIADLATNLINTLRYSNRPDRIQFEFYVTNKNDKEALEFKNHVVVINDKGGINHVTQYDYRVENSEKTTLLTPYLSRSRGVANTMKISENQRTHDNSYDLCKRYPILGCRINRGRPHWDKVFGYWMHLYPRESLNLYCCGPKNLVHLLRLKCKQISGETKNKFTFIHEGFG